MVRPSRLARKDRREHERQQENLRKQQLPTCNGCNLCSAKNTREIKRTTRDSDVPLSQQHVNRQSPRSKLRQFLKRDMLQGNILIATPHVTVAGRADDLGFGAEKERLVYWTDASKREDLRCGIGVVHQSSTELWDGLSWSVRASTDTHVLEIYAIAKALELAGERCRAVEAEQRPSSVCMYSDCSSALDFFLQPWQSLARLRAIPYGEELVGPGLLAVEELSVLNIPVELRWVRGHAGILGNQLADRAAKRGAKHSVGRRRAGLLMTLCGRREENGLQVAHTSRPIPWRMRLHPSTRCSS